MKLKEIKEKCKNLASVSTAYGISKIFNSETIFIKIYWLCFILISSCGASYYIFSDIAQYLNYEVVSLVKYQYEQPTEFPTVTFCSYSKKYFDNKNISQLIISTHLNYDFSLINSLEDDFESFLSESYGKCFRFNSGKNLKGNPIPIKNSTLGGYDDSFRLEIKAPTGLIVWIHNRTAPPRVENYNKFSHIPIFVSPEIRSFLVIDKILNFKLDMPFNKCFKNVTTEFDKNKTIIDYLNSMNETYSQIKCFELCFELKYIESNMCNCKNTKLGSVWIDCWLRNEESNKTSCTITNRFGFHKENLEEICSEYCPLECDSVSFTVGVNNLKVLNDVKNETVLLFAFYRSLQFTWITEQPKMKLEDLISNVGGYLGLFVGLSFVSLFEVAELIVELVFMCKNSNRVNLRS